MPAFPAHDERYGERIAAMFAAQNFMGAIGARIARLAPGEAEIELPYRRDLAQQNGYFHGGVTSAIADNAGGCAAFTLFPPGSDILTVEFKINLLAPAAGERLVAIGTVLKPGRTLTICDLKVYAVMGGERSLCASGQQTLIRLEREGERARRTDP
ncbi:MAG TPA: PaaI family thioesterase [Stellaceae bacterium]|nr:PaaI family thioesterase [Stellaceae bacterium]